MNPLIISHRGNGNSFPENTIPAMETALKQGANALELDVRLCADDELIVFHDFSLKRLFGSPSRVPKMTAEQLQKMRFKNIPQSAKTQIPKLSEVIEHFKNTIPINIEAKTGIFENRYFAHHLNKIIQSSGASDQIWVSSFNPLFLRALKSINNRIRTGFLFKHYFTFRRLRNHLNGIDMIHPLYSLINEDLVSDAGKRDMPIFAWTVNKSEEINGISRFEQIKGIITDAPMVISNYYIKKAENR